MKKLFTKGFYILSVIILFVGVAMPARAQYSSTVVENNGLYSAMAKDNANNIYIIKHSSPTAGEVVKYTGGTPAVIFTGLSEGDDTGPGGDLPWGLAVASNGDVYLTTDFTAGNFGGTAGGNIIKLASNNGTNGTVYTPSIFQNGGAYYTALAFDAGDNLYATQYDPNGNGGNGSYAIFKYLKGSAPNAAGTNLYDNLTAASGYTYPTGLAVAPNLDIYVTDPFNQDGSVNDAGKVLKLTKVSSYATAVTISSGTDATALTLDASGNLYTLENTGNSLSGYALLYYAGGTGTATTLYTPLNTDGVFSPYGVAVINPGNIYVADGDNGSDGGAVLKLTQSLPTISYNSPQLYLQNTVITPLAPTSSGVATPAYSTTPVNINTGLSSPFGVATDAAGNLYVSDLSTKIVKEFPAGGGTPVIIGSGKFTNPKGITVDAGGNVYAAGDYNGMVTEILKSNGSAVNSGTGFNEFSDVAVDAAGNIYVADFGNNNSVKEILKSNGSTVPIGTGFSNYSIAVATDAAGNVYVADTHNGIKEILASNGNTIDLGSGFNNPQGVAVDAVGNVFVSDQGNGAIKEIPVGSNTPITLVSGLTNPGQIAVDGAGNIYFVDNVANTVQEIKPVGGYYINALPPGLSFNNSTGVLSGTTGANIPPTNYTVTAYNANGSANAVINITIGVPPVPTLSYQGPQTYTTGAAITPLTPSSTGVSPLAYSGTKITVGTGYNDDQAVATDAVGNVYVADQFNNAVKKIPAGGGSQVTVASNLTGGLYGVAVDASGNLYVSESTNNTVLKIPAGGGSPVPIGTGFKGPEGLAVDAGGNVYVADVLNNAIKEILASNGSTVTLASNLGNGSGVAVDAAGNVYVAATYNNAVMKLPAGGGTPVSIGSGFNTPASVAVDAVGNVYVSDFGSKSIKMIAIGGGTTTIATNFSYPQGLAVDGAGNIFLADAGTDVVYQIKPTGGYYLNSTLPAGLSFNGATGVISGTPSVVSAAKDYTVTAYNVAGSAKATVNLTIVAPVTITSITRQNAALTNAEYAPYTVVFSGPVTGLKPSNFSVTTTNGITGANINDISGSGNTFTVVVFTGTGDGTITLNMANDLGVQPGISTALPFAGDTYTIDKTAPTVQATNVTFTGITTTSATANWTNGNGTARAVFISNSSTGSPAPVTGTTYIANAAFGSGTQIGTSNWYCVYNGTGTSVNITGLSAGNPYRVMTVEYTVTGNYLTTAGTGNPANFNTTSVADLNIANSDNQSQYTPGTTLTYTIAVNSSGPNNVTGAIVANTFPAGSTWTAVFAGGATGNASGNGSINETVNIPLTGSIVYTAIVPIPSSQTGSLNNISTVTVPAGVTDPNLANNEAQDLDTQNSIADLSITNTDGQATFIAGSTHTYTVVVKNNGPSDVTGATVTNSLPAASTWAAVFTGGATGAANGTGDINASVNIPSGGTITYTVTVPIPGTQVGSFASTATVTAPTGVTDPNTANNTATDTDAPQTSPVVTTTGGSTTYTGTPTAIDNGLTVTDIGSTTLASATVSISSGFQSGDRLNFTNQTGITGIFNAVTGVLTLSGGATLSQYQAALQSVSFATTSSNTASRTISFVVNDGTTISAAATKTVMVILPVITFSPIGSKPYGTPDFAPGATSTYTAVPITYTSSNTNIATIVNGNIHLVSGPVPPATSETVTITASQGGGATGTATLPKDVMQTLTITPATITFAAIPTKPYGTADFAPGATSTVSTTPITYTSSNTAIATIVGGNIHIIGTGNSNITASQGGGATGTATLPKDVTKSLLVTRGTLTITANDVDKFFGTTLTGGVGSTAFTAMGLNPSETIGSVSIAYGTGAAASATTGTYIGSVIPSAATGGTFNASNYNITYAPGNIIVVVPPPPVVTTSGSSTTYIGTAVVIDNGLTVTDVASVTLASATVSISTGFQTGDHLNFINQNGITGIFNAVTGVLTLSGGASLSNYQAALRSVSFSTTSLNTVTSTISFTVNDGTTNSAPATKTIIITPTTTISSITATDASPTNATTVQYNVKSGAAVTGLSTSNFSLTTTGTITGASITSRTGSGSTYTITVNTGTGDGNLTLNLANSTGISPGINNAPFTGDTYTVDKTAPIATSLIYASNNARSNYAKVGDMVSLNFGSNEAIQTPVVTIAGHTINAVSMGGNNYVASYTMTLGDTEGRIPFTLLITDLAGNQSSFTDLAAGDDITFDHTSPTVTINSPSVSSTNTGPVTYTITYADANFNTSSLVLANITPITTGTATGTVALSGSGTSYTVTISNISGTGTFGISIAAGTASDMAGNIAPAAGPSATFSVAPAIIPQTITFNALPTKTYGDADFSPGASSDNNGIPITYSSDNTAVATIVGGNIHIVSAGTAHITASQAGDATHSAAANVIQQLTVNKAALTITADNQSSTYGQALPTLTVSYSGFVNGDTQASLTTAATASTTATAASPASSYTITASGAVDNNYTISYVAGTLTIGKAALTITADNQNSTYGQALPALTVSYSGFVNGDTQASLTTAATASTPATAASPASSYTITASGAVDNNYTISYVAGTLTIGKASLTITADNQSSTYGSAIPTLTATFSGFVNGDNTSSLTTLPTLSTTATSASPANTYPITATGAVDNNYTISYVAGTLTIGKAALTITADNQSSTYGQALPALTVTYSGFVNGDTQASLTTAATASTTATAASPSGSYTITPGGAVDNNYTISYVAGTLTIGKAALTITADNQNSTYGQALPALTVTYSGFVNGDTQASLTTAATASTPATAASPAGSYTITPAGAVDNNYTISYVAGTLTIGKASLTITADNQSSTYGQALPALTVTYSGFVNGDTQASLTTAATASTTATAASPAGSYTITPAGAVDNNYVISYTNGTLTIGKAALTITADNQSTTYGQALPALTVTYSGFVNGDTQASLTTAATASTAATAASPAGSYTITASGAVDNNYAISYVAGTLTIGKAALTITADNQNSTYGSPIPTLTASFSGFVNGDTQTSLTTAPTLSTTATSSSPVNTYPITASGAVDNNYTISYVAGTLTIGKTALTITADNKSSTYGSPIPTLTASYSGFVNGDTQASLTTAPTLSTTATSSSPVNTYPITASGAVDNNYTISYVAGTLTITQAVRTLTFNALPGKTYGDPDFDPGATASTGEMVLYTSSNASVATIVNGEIHITGAGSTLITATLAANSNYSNTPTASQGLVVYKANQTISVISIPTLIKGSTYDLSVITATSGLPLTFTISDPTIASVQGQTLNALHIGTTNLTVTQAGDNNYNAAPNAGALITVSDVAGDEIVVHQAVSPNGDGINDFFLIEGIKNYPDNQVTIVNRNGVKIYQTRSYDNAYRVFDGHSNITGALQQAGTYFYLLEYSVNGESRRKTGFLVLKYQ